jgi:hypothetical protein
LSTKAKVRWEKVRSALLAQEETRGETRREERREERHEKRHRARGEESRVGDMTAV